MRLNKIAKDFNVGINTLVAFLEKYGGDPNMKWTPMSIVSDEQLALLSKIFVKDKAVREVSERERQERLLTRDKIKEETRQINAVNSGIPQSQQAAAKPQPAPQPKAEEPAKTGGLKILGHIDLDAYKKPAPVPEPKKNQKTENLYKSSSRRIKHLVEDYYFSHNESVSATVQYIYSFVEKQIEHPYSMPFGNDVINALFNTMKQLYADESDIFQNTIDLYESQDKRYSEMVRGNYLVRFHSFSKNRKNQYTQQIGKSGYCFSKDIKPHSLCQFVLLLFIASEGRYLFLEKELENIKPRRKNYTLLKYEHSMNLETDVEVPDSKLDRGAVFKDEMDRQRKNFEDVIAHLKQEKKQIEEQYLHERKELMAKLDEVIKLTAINSEQINQLENANYDYKHQLEEKEYQILELKKKQDEGKFDNERERLKQIIAEKNDVIEENRKKYEEEKQLFKRLISEGSYNDDVRNPVSLYPEKKIKPKGVEDTKGVNIVLYGAPGTGKSYTIKNTIKGLMPEGNSKDRIEGLPKGKAFRTTFHPDTDYSSFVGCYKPTMRGRNIVYAFRPQVFLKAYVEAWINPNEQYYLVIEELNRGNCAQIFGDMFQLLDRKPNGDSSYLITPDQDISKWLREEAFWYRDIDKDEVARNHYEDVYCVQLKERYGEEFEEQIFADCAMALPRNLTILSTLNTSDQSLFPMDSAFKRRWKWRYVPIKKKRNEITIQFNIEGKEDLPWERVLIIINNFIKTKLRSTDKQIGEHFLRASINDMVSFEDFRDKVLFYLFNDVFKDDNRLSKSIWKEQSDKMFVDLYEEEEKTKQEIHSWLMRLDSKEQE